MLRRALFALFWLVIVLYVINQPASAAHAALLIVHAIGTAARALGRFSSFL
jgi:hypothetical protein